MAKLEAHWTARDVDSFLFRITSDFVRHVEVLLESNKASRADLAGKLRVTPGRISQVLNDPGNLSLKQIIKYTRALGEKIAVVTYDDNDPDNTRGPIVPEVFVKCWEKAGKPIDLFDLEEQSVDIHTFTVAQTRGVTTDRIERPLEVDQTAVTPTLRMERSSNG